MDSIRETLEKAGGVPESARVAIDGGVDAVVRTASKQVAIAAEHVSGYARVASAHADAAYLQMREYENRAFRAPVATVKRAVTAYPYETAFGSLVASALVLPAPRRALFRLALGARSSEEAIFKRASRGSEAAKDSANAAEKELKVLRNAAVAAETEMLRGRNGLRRAAAGLKKLKSASTRDAAAVGRARRAEASAVGGGGRRARGRALTKAQVQKVRAGVDAALADVWRAGVQI